LDAHTGENIYASYINIINAYYIETKISYVITDNASNMIKAFCYLGMTKEPSFEDASEADCLLDENSEIDLTDEEVSLSDAHASAMDTMHSIEELSESVDDFNANNTLFTHYY
jgi:hypothetical protein